MKTLATYEAYVDRYGPECVLIDARRNLDDADLERLATYVRSKQRRAKFVRGVWVDRHIKVRKH